MPREGANGRRLAGAPISWGVCEVPGWGLQLPATRVLAEMAALGLTATELGPLGYLGDDPSAVRAALDGTGCGSSAGSCPSCCTTPPPTTRRAPTPDAAPSSWRLPGPRSSSPPSSRD